MKTIEEIEALREMYLKRHESADDAERIILSDKITILNWVLGDMA
jgi:hypothetical protein